MTEPQTSLDPADWTGLRALGHRMLDHVIDRLARLRQGKVWQPMPAPIRASFRTALPRTGIGAEAAYDEFLRRIAPYASGNTHPRFMGWVQGGGNPVAMLTALLEAGLNENCGGRDHVGLAVERQIIAWSAEMLGLPTSTGGLLVTGSSMANFIAVLCARRQALGADVRTHGLGSHRLTGYAQTGVHRCVPGAFDMAGIGSDALRRIPTNAACQINLAALEAQIIADRATGHTPFLIVATAGTVDVGAIDPLPALADLAAQYGLWLHVDAAFAALAALSPRHADLLTGIDRADSVAFDFHKWAQIQYDCGCVLVRAEQLMLDSFAQNAPYLSAAPSSAPRGLAGGTPWPCDLGPDLSRSFRALKIWMTLQSYGADALGAVVDQTCAVASHLGALIDATPGLTRLAPVALNIVGFRYDDGGDDLDALNADLVADLQESGEFVVSSTLIDGQRAIRAAFVNHRTVKADADALVAAILAAATARQRPTQN
jgi:glutamate/tyrosine decarboxylase-like PLP-dependent enzyme